MKHKNKVQIWVKRHLQPFLNKEFPRSSIQTTVHKYTLLQCVLNWEKKSTCYKINTFKRTMYILYKHGGGSINSISSNIQPEFCTLMASRGIQLTWNLWKYVIQLKNLWVKTWLEKLAEFTQVMLAKSLQITICPVPENHTNIQWLMLLTGFCSTTSCREKKEKN